MLTSFSTRSAATGGNKSTAAQPTTARLSTQHDTAMNHDASKSLQSTLNSSANASTGTSIVTPTSTTHKRDLADADTGASSKKRLLLDGTPGGTTNVNQRPPLSTDQTWVLVDRKPGDNHVMFENINWISPPFIIQSAIDLDPSSSTSPSPSAAIDSLLDHLQSTTSTDALTIVIANYGAVNEKIPKTKSAQLRRLRKLFNERLSYIE